MCHFIYRSQKHIYFLWALTALASLHLFHPYHVHSVHSYGSPPPKGFCHLIHTTMRDEHPMILRYLSGIWYIPPGIGLIIEVVIEIIILRKATIFGEDGGSIIH